MPEWGPFSVDPRQVQGLDGADFADLVGRILAAESARAGQAGWKLTQTYRVNAADGGVDAGLNGSAETSWLPFGDSAWQFKAGDLAPAACEAELRGATAAIEILRSGGSYRLVVGKSLAPNLVATRKARLEKTARLLGIDVQPGTIEVFNGDSLARWAEEFPAVASSPLIRGVGTIGQTFGEWSASVAHTTTWVQSDTRDRQIEDLRTALRSEDESGVHIEGVSGLGKTRMVMEALRGQLDEALVVYVPSEDQFPPAVLNHLQTHNRTAVIVIDECDAKRHDVFSAMLQSGTKIRLLTISEPSQRASRATTLLVNAFEDEPLSTLLKRNVPTLWPEATRVIVEISAGNIDYALKCAKALIAQRPESAHQLVDPADIRQFIVDELPGGALFLASCALALFSRIGFDGELATELQAVSTALAVTETDLRAAAAELTDSGLLTSHGRYRSVGPNPVAIYLASRGWAEFGSKVVSDLIPILSENMVERLFARAAEIGDSALTREVVDQVLGGAGPLSSLEAVAHDRRSNLLDHLAILSPERVSSRITELLESVTHDELVDAQDARRPLMWALQKLAWHSSTFQESADSLLRLAHAENETYTNNSTGVWVDLFGTMLPSTAASPNARLVYLEEKLGSDDPRTRSLVVAAASRALEFQESTMVSGELQGGVVVEPRGVPATWHEVWSYRNAMVDILRVLVDDADGAISKESVDALVRSIHGVLGSKEVRAHLATALATLPPSNLQSARAELGRLSSLYERTGDDHHFSKEIDAIVAALPEESTEDRLWVLAHASPWDRHNGDIESEMLAILGDIPPTEGVEMLTRVLASEVLTDFTLGRVIGRLCRAEVATENFLIERLVAGVNPRALTGYLVAREEVAPGSYDKSVDSMDVELVLKLGLSTQGPRTERATERITQIIPEVSVADGARAIFYWLRGVTDEALLHQYVEGWRGRVESQQDYSALVDFLAFAVHDLERFSTDLGSSVFDVVAMRVTFPDLGQQGYEWIKLAERQLEKAPRQIVDILITLVESSSVSMYSESREKELFRKAVKLSGPEVWSEIMDRLTLRESWKLSFATRGWLADVVDIEIVKAWVGSSKERARIVASVASLGKESLSSPSVFLLDKFGEDERVSSALVGEFISGGWTGDESIRIRNQIEQVKGWQLQPRQSQGVKKWCRKLVVHLESQLVGVEQREQEGEW